MSRKTLREIASKPSRKTGDAIEGETIIAQARDVTKPRAVPGTSTHKIQELFLKRNALAVIDKPFRLLGSELKLKKQKDEEKP